MLGEIWSFCSSHPMPPFGRRFRCPLALLQFHYYLFKKWRKTTAIPSSISTSAHAGFLFYVSGRNEMEVLLFILCV